MNAISSPMHCNDFNHPSAAALTGLALWAMSASLAWGFTFYPEIRLETRIFTSSPQFDRQLQSHQTALVFAAEGRWQSEDRRTRLRFEPLARLDSRDPNRRYFDLREASWSHEIDTQWDVLAGVSQVFWGVAESRNVVDIINQFDTIEDIDEGEKMGQPMVRLSRRGAVGTFEFYYLPYFRERLFPSAVGRLRGPFTVDDDGRFERDGDAWAGDFALRYAKRAGDFDLGLHGFYGTSRNPRFDPGDAGDPWVAFYPRLAQTGLDLQWTSQAWLLKTELVVAKMLGEVFTSAVGGLEYTFFDVGGAGLDLGLIAEYLYDDRDLSSLPSTLFDDDYFLGARITLNDVQDTELLAGAIIDRHSNAAFMSAELQRRIGSRSLLELEARAFSGRDDPLLIALRSDDNITARFTFFF